MINIYLFFELILGSIGGVFTLALGGFCFLVYIGLMGKKYAKQAYLFWFGLLMVMTGLWAIFEVWNQYRFFFGLELAMTYLVGTTLPTWFYILVQSIKSRFRWNLIFMIVLLLQIGIAIIVFIPEYGMVSYQSGVGVLRLRSTAHLLFSLYMVIISSIGFIALYRLNLKSIVPYGRGILIATIVPFTVIVVSNLILPYFGGDNSYHRVGPIALIFLVSYISYLIVRKGTFRVSSILFQVYGFLLILLINIIIQLALSFLGIVSVLEVERIILIGILISVGWILVQQTLKGAQEERLMLQTQTKLEHLIEEKDRFLQISSHQLRTPLTAMKGYLQILEDIEPAKSAAIQPYLRQMQSVLYSMGSVIEDILNMNTIHSGKFVVYKKDKIDLKQCLEEVIQVKSFWLDKLGIKYQLKLRGQDFLIRGDLVKIKEVLHNVIDNAIHYTKNTVQVQLIAQTKQIQIKIKDDGIGFSKEERKLLFRPYQRGAYARRLRPEGTGLGLYLVKTIIKHHNGQVFLTSSGRDRGSLMSITLPRFRI